MKIFILGLIILLTILYIHIIIQNKNNAIHKDTFNTTEPLSVSLTKAVASKLNISSRRIQNIKYTGDISTQQLQISFTILDPNMIEIGNSEPSAGTVAQTANDLFKLDAFVVKINNTNIKLQKLNQQPDTIQNASTSTSDNSVYFNNIGLKNIANYAQQKYTYVPTDKSLTQFYSLKFDDNYNLKPILE